jgi:hypothetical protein
MKWKQNKQKASLSLSELSLCLELNIGDVSRALFPSFFFFERCSLVRVYVLKRFLFKRLQKQFGSSLKYVSCNLPFEEGDIVVSATGHCCVLLRHKACFEKNTNRGLKNE